jgi:hypothetical protein
MSACRVPVMSARICPVCRGLAWAIFVCYLLFVQLLGRQLPVLCLGPPPLAAAALPTVVSTSRPAMASDSSFFFTMFPLPHRSGTQQQCPRSPGAVHGPSCPSRRPTHPTAAALMARLVLLPATAGQQPCLGEALHVYIDWRQECCMIYPTYDPVHCGHAAQTLRCQRQGAPVQPTQRILSMPHPHTGLTDRSFP